MLVVIIRLDWTIYQVNVRREGALHGALHTLTFSPKPPSPGADNGTMN